jgi:hypothetical protein
LIALSVFSIKKKIMKGKTKIENTERAIKNREY